jgi:glycine cleavage system H protein
MVIVLLIVTFAACILVDWMIRRRESRETGPVRAVPIRPANSLQPPIYAGGFRLQPEMAYHPGHTWLSQEGHDTARVGLDDFCSRLLGEIDAVELPDLGDQVGQGQPAIATRKDGRKIAVLSPVAGRVLAVNQEVVADPRILVDDPYGEGWLMVVQSRDLKTSMNNLLSGDLVRRWMEDISARLRSFLPGGVAYSFPDGGAAVDDISKVVDGPTWEKMLEEFLLSRSSPHP